MQRRSEVVGWEQVAPESMLIRRIVFQEEQAIPAALDFDGRDPNCRHCLVTVADRPAGVARLDGTHIQRIAVLPEFRGQGIGTLLIEALVAAAREQGLVEVVADAQATSVPIFRRLGFEIADDPRIVVGIEHWSVRQRLTA
jgi:GNAT superfamily N-acetyltransferase